MRTFSIEHEVFFFALAFKIFHFFFAHGAYSHVRHGNAKFRRSAHHGSVMKARALKFIAQIGMRVKMHDRKIGSILFMERPHTTQRNRMLSSEHKRKLSVLYDLSNDRFHSVDRLLWRIL